jgi:hypothetical protein
MRIEVEEPGWVWAISGHLPAREFFLIPEERLRGWEG